LFKIDMSAHSAYATECAAAHILGHSDYPVKKIITKHQLPYIATYGTSKHPGIPQDLTAAQVHLEVFDLAFTWKMP